MDGEATMSAPLPTFDVEVTISDHTALRLLAGASAQFRRKVLAEALVAAGEYMQAEVQNNVRATFGGRGWRSKPEGKKRRAIRPEYIDMKINRSKMEATIWPNTISGNIHELGGTILPKRKKLLSWIENRPQRGTDASKNREDGGWRWFVKRVRIPARQYIEPAAYHGLRPAAEAATRRILRMLGA